MLEGYNWPWEPEGAQNISQGDTVEAFWWMSEILILSEAEPRHGLYWTHQPWPFSFSHYPVVMSSCEGRRVNWPQNGELCWTLSLQGALISSLLSPFAPPPWTRPQDNRTPPLEAIVLWPGVGMPSFSDWKPFKTVSYASITACSEQNSTSKWSHSSAGGDQLSSAPLSTKVCRTKECRTKELG